MKRMPLLIAVVAVTIGVSSCQKADDEDLDLATDLFGDTRHDASPVICEVDGVKITQRDLEMRMEDMPKASKSRFSGEDWERRLLEYMIGEAILAQDAIRAGLQHESAVSRQLINLRRTTMRDAYASLVLWDDLEPSREEIERYYEENQATFYTQGSVKARHIQCDTRLQIDRAWEKLQGSGYENLFANVAGEFSNNSESLKRNSELGWFARGGYISALPYGKEFSERIYDWDIGVHPPEYIGEHWHIVEILNREPSRQLALSEVRDRIVAALLPSVRQNATDEYVAKRHQEVDLEYFGDYRPGRGRTADELLKLGMLANTPERQEALYDLLLLDYHDSEYAPMALFMKANLYLDTTGDKYRARNCLNRILKNYPDSELREQVEYMLENMSRADFHTPTSIEELRDLAD
ncbi:peptidyl-prolyl cis-trans isomerase [bacterium]|nr:peptidyl-prolyl cis-trans isomerase [bacterium]MBU1071618.1 peptidyl-prolyl cis-trans isomerase [bacterium]MBU1676110.1 peptidyl-prolyl cis-trans isomerase [bacterium]